MLLAVLICFGSCAKTVPEFPNYAPDFRNYAHKKEVDFVLTGAQEQHHAFAPNMPKPMLAQPTKV